MTPDQLVGYFVAHDDMVNSANRTKDIARAMNKTSLALKAKVVQYHEEDDEDKAQYEEQEMTSTSELDVDLAFFAKKYGKFTVKKGGFTKEKKRFCYNCDESGHFADKCPYEKKEDKPKYTKETRTKLKPNHINLKNKRKEFKALLGTEYTSDGEEDEEDEQVVGVAGLALAEPGSLFKYDYSKDYKSTNNNSSHTCLMAMGAKVTSSSTPSSAMNNDDLDEDALLAKLYKVMCSLRGEARAQFEYLMDTVAQRNETIKELNTHIEDGVQRYNLLRQELSDEKNTSFMLSQQIAS